MQGYSLPFSYGLYTSDNWDGYILMLENVEGDTIEAIRENLLDEPVERLKQLFLGAWKELKRIHAMQIAHCDIREENLIVSREGSFVFVDWEASKYGFAPSPPPQTLPLTGWALQISKFVCILAG